MRPVQQCDDSTLKRCGTCIVAACLRIDASFRVYDGRAILVGGAARTVFGTAKAAPKVGGPVGGAGQVLGWIKALRPTGVADFSVRRPKGPLGALL